MTGRPDSGSAPGSCARRSRRGPAWFTWWTPSNPLGSVQTEAEIREIAQICRDAGSILIHDCTYRHFAAGHTLAAEHFPEGTITTYSFSKWLGIAGLRLGALVASPELIGRLAQAPPNNLGASVLAQRAALAGLEHKSAWFPAVQDAQLANQAALKAAVDGIAGLELTVYPSNGNFVCIDVAKAGVAPERLCEYYLERNILVRQAGLPHRTLRLRFHQGGHDGAR